MFSLFKSNRVSPEKMEELQVCFLMDYTVNRVHRGTGLARNTVSNCFKQATDSLVARHDKYRAESLPKCDEVLYIAKWSDDGSPPETCFRVVKSSIPRLKYFVIEQSFQSAKELRMEYSQWHVYFDTDYPWKFSFTRSGDNESRKKYKNLTTNIGRDFRIYFSAAAERKLEWGNDFSTSTFLYFVLFLKSRLARLNGFEDEDFAAHLKETAIRFTYESDIDRLQAIIMNEEEPVYASN